VKNNPDHLPTAWVNQDRIWHQSDTLCRKSAEFHSAIVPTSAVDRISWDESKVFVHLPKEAVEQSPQHHLTPVGTVLD
jgi:hypothetical protein